MWQLNCTGVYAQGAVDTVGATSPHVNVSTIRNFLLVQPPIEEQQLIGAVLDDRVREFDVLIRSAEQSSRLLEERRSALVSAAVTGQIDVRPESQRTAA